MPWRQTTHCVFILSQVVSHFIRPFYDIFTFTTAGHLTTTTKFFHSVSVFQSVNMICAKCFEVFNNLDEIYASLCGHCFHRACIADNCSACPSCFQVLSGSFNFIKLNAIFENETHAKEKLKKVIEVREQNKFLKYQLHKTREDMQKMKNDLEKSRLLCTELQLDIEAERKMRRIHQLELESALPTSLNTDDREVIISSDEEPAMKKRKTLSPKKVEKAKKKIRKTRMEDCRSCKTGCNTNKCPCFKSSQECYEKCRCTECDNKKGKKKLQKVEKVIKNHKTLPAKKV